MAQYDHGTISPAISGTALAEALSRSNAAKLSGHSGAARPFYATAGLKWVKVVSATVEETYLFDGTEDVLLWTLNPTTHKVVFAGELSAAYVPVTRKLIGGTGVKLNGGTEASLAGDVTISVAGVPTGAVMGFDLTAPPAGWIVGDGSAINRHTYSDLDATMYCGDALNATATAWYRCTNPANPNGSRSTTGDYLVTRDLRGLFTRFLDGGRGYDSGRVLGSEQGDQNLSHSHGVNDPGHSHSVNDPGHSHSTVFSNGNTAGGSLRSFTSLEPNVQGNQVSVGGSGTGISINGSVTGISLQSSGGAEARPKNIALLGCIKY